MHRKRPDARQRELLATIETLSQRMETTRCLLNSTNDDDLLESCIYELKYLQTRYTYLLRLARQEGCEDCRILRPVPLKT